MSSIWLGLCPGARSIFGDATPLYRLEWVSYEARRRRRDGLTGMGEFGDLERFLVRAVSR